MDVFPAPMSAVDVGLSARPPNDFLGKPATSKKGPQRWGTQFTECSGYKCKILSPLIVEVADLP